jgi:hypothetical protein
VKMLTIIQQDQPGLLADITTTLELAQIDLLDFSGQAIGGTAVISLHVEPYRAAFRTLSDAGYRVISHQHLLLRLDRHPGSLAKLSRRLADAQVEIRGLSIVNKDETACIVALETTDTDKACKVLADMLVLESPKSPVRKHSVTPLPP